MAPRPYWSGQIRISLVFLPVQVYNATLRSASIPLRELSRDTGERIHHRNVTASGEEVDSDDIVKGYEYEKGQYVLLEDEDLEKVKLPSSDTLELVEFVDADSIPLIHYERPYYVLPNGKNAGEIYTVIRDALREAGKVGIGQIALRGREELVALSPLENGLLMETLRYPQELRNPREFFEDIDTKKASSDYVALARELIKRNSGKLDMSRFHDHYHEAMQELINSRIEHRKPQFAKAKAPPTKVVNLMDALRQSLNANDNMKAARNDNKPAKKTAPKHRKKPVAKKAAGKRKSA
ncbi:MAG: Ku protein [Alphaproteobacteria bacterium]|nr:Ku protein [Alphaproteobacteria bacterium]